MLSLEVEAQPVPQETTKNHKTTQRSVVQGEKQRQREGTEPNKGTVRERKRRVQQTPEERTMTETLEHRRQPQYQPSRIGAVTREGRYWESSRRRRRRAKEPATEGMLRGAKLSVGLRSTRGEKERRSDLGAIRYLHRADS